MSKNLKKFFAMTLAVIMVLAMLPTGVFAADADLKISTAAQLKAFADAVNAGDSFQGKTVVLTNDIDLEYTAVVIGTKANPFMGTFDGQNYTVSNLYIYEDGTESDYFADSDNCVGLFGVLNAPGIVKNVTVDNPYIVGSAYVGGIVGMAYTGTIENCHVTGEIDIEGFYMVGGITGHGYARIYDCSVIGQEGWDYNYIGATYKETDLEGDKVGGIVGHNAEGNVISGCTVKNVTVSGTRTVGGVVGTTAQSTKISNCVVSNVIVETTATAEYAADNYKTMSIGGVVGQYMANGNGVGGELTNCSVSGLTFANENGVTVNAGALTGGVRNSSGITVAPDQGSITNSGNAVADVAGETVTYMEPEAVKVATYDELVAALANGGEIKLTADITTTAALTTSGVTANIDLNGYTLTIGAGDNKFNDASNITISNGKIDITGVSVKGNAIFCLDENEKTLVTTLTLNDVDLTGNDYSSAYGVFYIGSSSVLNVNGGQWNLSNDTHGSGGVFKADAAEATLNIDGLELNAHNVRRVVTYAATTINNSTLTITGDADGVDAEMEHGFNRSPLTITNSTITMKDMVGRGITAEKGAVTINNSTVTIENVQEATIEVRGGQTVTVSADSTVSVDAEPTISNGTIQGTVQIPSNGSVTVAYTKEVDGYVRIWGEGRGNASESYALKLYAGEELVATTVLNNIGGIIDGDVNVTWNFFYPQSNDEYWTTTWEEGHPNSIAQPDKVVLYIDGEAVSENIVKMCAPDDLNPVAWAELGGVKKIVVGLTGSGTQADPFLINDLDELKWFRDSVNGGNSYNGKVVALAEDIDLGNEEWTPIGNSSNKFQGIFDGQDHTISNLSITGNNSNVGLFGFTTNGEIKNLTVHNAKVSGYLNVAVVAGTPYTSKYTNIKVTGDVIVEGFSYVGGVGGKNAYANWNNITVDVNEGSYVKANSVNAEGVAYRTYVGGVIGFMGEGTHSVENVTSNIDVIGSTCDVGGIVGIAHEGNKFINITCSGDVTVENSNADEAVEAGGIAGVWMNSGRDVTFENVTYTGTLSAPNASGIVFENGGLIGTGYGTTTSNGIVGSVAIVAGKTYADLYEAMTACKAGETVVLISDVDLAGTEWEPVSFKGAFDGNGHTISNLTINKPGVSSVGFITSLNGSFKNVTFTNPTVIGGENTGVVAGRAGGSAALAENITVNGTIKVETTHSGYARAGVIVGGWAYGNYRDITVDGGDKAVSYIKHTGGGDGRYVGGIVGHADDVDSYVNCTVKNITISGGWLCGAIAGPGPSDGLTSGCTVENVNIAADYSGGMFGWYFGNGTIENSTIKDVAFTDGTAKNGAIGGYNANPEANVVNVTIENVTNNGKALLEHVAAINGTYYFSLEEALTAANDGDTVTLLKDITLDKMLVNTNKITLDLNGKTITGIDNTAKNFSLIDNRGELTITGNGIMTLTATTNSGWNRYSAVIANNPGGKLVVENGTIEHLGGTDMAYGIDNLTNGKGTYAETVINDGTIKSTYRAIRQFLNGVEAQNILTINGGTVEGVNNGVFFHDPSTKANSGTLTIGENATVSGVYLFVTEGSTEWPVTVSISTKAVSADKVISKNVPDGYAVEGRDGVIGIYELCELPTADVEEIENDDLTFAMNFLAVVPTDKQLAYYGDWYADFELTVNKDVTFNANGDADGYLSGQYDAWSQNWVNVPGENVTLNANTSLKIMEYASKLMGKPGLKLTYNDVATFVKDFNCGVYFTPEFLAANPDLKVTLELKMYNPENEAENYVIGETYVFENDAVAYNKETGKLYNDLVAGLREAEANETVVLLRDVTVREVSVYEDITLDLDGHNLTATYVNVYGNLVDNSQSNAGRLVISESKMMFRNNNAQVPVKTETGYAFVEIVKFNAAFDKTGKFHFQPVFEAYGCELLKNGTTGTGVSIQVALSWKVGSETRTQYVQYNDTLVQAFFASYNASTGKYGKDFTLMISNAADFQDLTYTVCVVAGTVVCSNA